MDATMSDEDVLTVVDEATITAEGTTIVKISTKAVAEVTTTFMIAGAIMTKTVCPLATTITIKIFTIIMAMPSTDTSKVVLNTMIIITTTDMDTDGEMG